MAGKPAPALISKIILFMFVSVCRDSNRRKQGIQSD